jgi:hypothetical protein|nr:MAG TPA: ECF sigma factor [Caudoviricetes sp.]
MAGDGNFRSCANGFKEELRPQHEYEYEYTASTVWNMICNKDMIVDKRNQGNFYYAEMLIDCEIIERMYLSKEQRNVIYCYFELQKTVRETARILHRTQKSVRTSIESIRPTLMRYLP